MKLYKQYPKDKRGRPGYIDWHDNMAYWFTHDSPVAVLEGPIVRYMTSDGMLISGYAPAGFYKNGRGKFKLQEWFISFGGE